MGLSVGKLNGFKMSEVTLKVEAASFSKKDEPVGESSEGENGGEAAADNSEGGVYDDSDFDADGVPLYRPLPLECKAATCPTCVLRHVYTANDVSKTHFLYSVLVSRSQYIVYNTIVVSITRRWRCKTSW